MGSGLWRRVICYLLARVHLALVLERRELQRSTRNRLDYVVVYLGIIEKIVSALTILNPTSLMMIRVVHIFRSCGSSAP